MTKDNDANRRYPPILTPQEIITIKPMTRPVNILDSPLGTFIFRFAADGTIIQEGDPMVFVKQTPEPPPEPTLSFTFEELACLTDLLWNVLHAESWSTNCIFTLSDEERETFLSYYISDKEARDAFYNKLLGT